MREVAILGIGQTKIDEHWDLSLREIGGNAAFAAMQDAGMDRVDALFVGNMLSPLVSGLYVCYNSSSAVPQMTNKLTQPSIHESKWSRRSR